jgi:glycosyltransferase involved in cell wall biosynthesis
VIKGKKVVVVMPAYNAELTIEKTWREVLEQEVVDLVIIVDDASQDKTAELARHLKDVVVHVHAQNKGYGANQKTCYRLALDYGADIVVMVHPDYQYTPKLIPAMAGLVASGIYGCVLGSRILGGQALIGGMPLWRYVANRMLTLVGNVLLGTKVSEFHTGYRAFARELLHSLPLSANSDDFVFDNEILAETVWLGHAIGEVSCPTSYAPDASSINFRRSVRYGFGCISTALAFRCAKMGFIQSPRFPNKHTAGRAR